MVVVKFLEKKSVIRLFGLALIAAPFFNPLISALLSHIQNPGSLQTLLTVVRRDSFYNHTLAIASLGIGLFMLSGLSSAWKYALILLGGHIVQQTLNLGHNLRISWFLGVIYLLNIGLFLFIADQLVWKLKINPQKTMKTASPKKIFVEFEGIGPWAQLLAISNHEIHLRCLTSPPLGIDKHQVEIRVHNNLSLRLVLLRKSETDFFFGYQDLKSSDIQSLNFWLQQQVA